MSRLFITFLLLMACPTGSQAEALSREKIDGWLQHLGASDKFDASKGIDWGVMPGPFMVRKLNRPFLSFLTMNSVKEEPHMVRAVAE